jgi:type IV secretory pathway VirB2 component (pilin)
MFGLTKKQTYILLLALAVVICLPMDALAAFDTLKTSGQTIFTGLKKIIYPASAIGIICVCIGGFFGNINWKWLLAIVVGLVVISGVAGLLSIFIEDTSAIPNGTMDGK